MTKTEENLKEAFAGESQANRKYLAFAKQAEAEGHRGVAKLFKAAAEAETVHAHKHLEVLGGIRDTKENLKEAVAGENHEHEKMYPQFIKDAKEEEKPEAEKSFTRANAAEKVHENLYKKALETLEKGEEYEVSQLYVCPVCGHTVENEAPEKCPVCGTEKALFIEVK